MVPSYLFPPRTTCAGAQADWVRFTFANTPKTVATRFDAATS